MRKLRKEKKKGFTLIELVIVVGIMALIVMIALPNLIGAKKKKEAEIIETRIDQLEELVKGAYEEGLIDEDAKFDIEGEKIIPTKGVLNEKELKGYINNKKGSFTVDFEKGNNKFAYDKVSVTDKKIP